MLPSRSDLVRCCVAWLLLAGCAGELKDPERFRAAQGGEGGSGGEAGAGGGAGDGGGAGFCDAPELVLKEHCSTGCHSATSQLGGLDLQSPDLVGRLRGVKGNICSGVPLIDPDAPEKSALYDKTSAQPSCGGDRMPLTGDLLTEQERACLLDWLQAVAPSP
jgi:hypothetical protein